jgi:superfamily II DNA or RNA helicase
VLAATYQMVWRWYDNPEVDVVVLAFSWRAEAPIIQAVGRWLRSLPWKKDVFIYDIYNPSWIMMNQRRQRRKYYERFTTQINHIKFVTEEI